MGSMGTMKKNNASQVAAGPTFCTVDRDTITDDEIAAVKRSIWTRTPAGPRCTDTRMFALCRFALAEDGAYPLGVPRAVARGLVADSINAARDQLTAEGK